MQNPSRQVEPICITHHHGCLFITSTPKLHSSPLSSDDPTKNSQIWPSITPTSHRQRCPDPTPTRNPSPSAQSSSSTARCQLPIDGHDCWSRSPDPPESGVLTFVRSTDPQCLRALLGSGVLMPIIRSPDPSVSGVLRSGARLCSGVLILVIRSPDPSSGVLMVDLRDVFQQRSPNAHLQQQIRHPFGQHLARRRQAPSSPSIVIDADNLHLAVTAHDPTPSSPL
ncbi:hypothetical protein ACLOJK_004464 [Asimina triloba]